MKKKPLSLMLVLALCLGLSTPALAAGYSGEQLCDMAKSYYQNTHHYSPQYVTVEGESSGIVTLHLYDIVGNHTATSDWYYIDRNTGKGTNLLGNSIDLTPYGPAPGNHSPSKNSGTCGAGLTWKLENGTLTISGTGPMTAYEYDADYVAAGPAPWNGLYFQEAVIEPGVTSVGSYAFFEYNDSVGMKSITLPNSLTRIGQDAFGGYNLLRDVYYGGTQEEWAKLKSASGGENDNLWNAPNIHFAASSAPAGSGFTDVAASSPYAGAISWAVEQKITNGITPTTFGPSNTCTVSHILTFLYRAVKGPSEDDSRAPVTAWANSLGIDTGNLDAPCTRAAAVTYLWKAAGSPAPSNPAGFADVPASAAYAKAVSWAVENGVANGTSFMTFSPDQICTRGQIVTFLYRAM